MRTFILAAGLALAIPALAFAQTRVIREPTFGVVKGVYGAALPLAEPHASCREAQPDGACFDGILQSMRARGVSAAMAVGAGVRSQDGAVTAAGSGAVRLYDIRVDGPTATITPRPGLTSEVRVPTNCAALPGEGLSYRIETRGGQRVAQEMQVVVCDGPMPAPQGPYPVTAMIPEQPPALGAAPATSGQTHPAAAILPAQGPPRAIAPTDAACPAEAPKRDGFCFAAAATQMAGQAELDVLGVPALPAIGQEFARNEPKQYVLKLRRNGRFEVDRRWTADFFLRAPEGCRLTTELRFRAVEAAEGVRLAEVATATCGAPPASTPVRIVEAYGAEIPVAAGGVGGCANALLPNMNVCFDAAIRFLRAAGRGSGEVLLLQQRHGPGTRMFNRGPIPYGFAELSSRPDGTWSARQEGTYTPAIDFPSRACTFVPDAESNEATGVVLFSSNGFLMARHYRWMACRIW